MFFEDKKEPVLFLPIPQQAAWPETSHFIIWASIPASSEYKVFTLKSTLEEYQEMKCHVCSVSITRQQIFK